MYAPWGSIQERLTPREGERFYNPALASSLASLAKHGCAWFYSEAVTKIFTQLGYVDKDEESWRENPIDHATWEKPVSTNFSLNGTKDRYQIYSVGGNSQGATANLILNVLQRSLAGNSSLEELIHKHINAKRAVYRTYYRNSIPDEVLTKPDFAESLAGEVMEAFQAKRMVSAHSIQEKTHDTESFVVRDGNGVTIAALQSIALPFGSGIVVPSLGFALHGRGYGFSTGKDEEFSFDAQRRPWTTLSPYVVERNGHFWMAAAVKGGDRQPYAFTQIFMNLVQGRMVPPVAVALPRFRDSSHHGLQVVEWDQPMYSGVFDLHGYNVTSISYVFKSLAEKRGCKGVVYDPLIVEDSGFGVAQLLLEDSQTDLADPGSLTLSTQLIAVTDLSRKPGLAIVGSKHQMFAAHLEIPKEIEAVVDARDIAVLARPLRNFMSSHLKPLSESEIVELALEGSVQERDWRFEPNRVRIAIQNSGMWTTFFLPNERTRLHDKTNIDLVRIRHESMWNFHDFQAIVPSTICTNSVYDEIAHGSVAFPTGLLPVIRPDRYMVSLSEDNFRFYLLLKSHSMARNVPSLIDSREKKWSNLFHLARQVLAERKGPEVNVSSYSKEITEALKCQGIDFPLVAKMSEGATSGNGVKIIQSIHSLATEVDRRLGHNESFVLQQALKGEEEYTIHFISHFGRLVAAECFKNIFPKKAGDLFVKGYKRSKALNKGRSWLGCNDEVSALRLVESFARDTFYNGIGCLQYKKDPFSHEPMIIEVNPRVCSGIMRSDYFHKLARMFVSWIKVNDKFF